MPNDGQEWLSRKEAAAYLQKNGCPITPATLANLAQHENKAGGPPFTKYGKKLVRYLKADLLTWAAMVTRKVA